jgi:hypothetical protein
MAMACSTYSAYAVAHTLMEFGIARRGQLLLPAGALVGLTCSTLWTSLGLCALSVMPLPRVAHRACSG